MSQKPELINQDSLLNLSQSLIFSYPDSALHYGYRGLTFSKSSGNKTIEAEILHAMGSAFMVQGEYDSARIYFYKSLTISEKEQNLDLMSRSYAALGLTANEQGDINKALRFYYQALDIDRKTENQEGIHGNLINIARIHSFQEEYDKALALYTQALAYFERENHTRGISICYNNMGYIYQRLNEYDRALDLYQKALDISDKAGNPQSTASYLNNIARLNFLQGSFQKALKNYHKAIAIETETDDKKNLSHSYLGLAQLWLDRNEPDSAEHYADESLKLSKNADAFLEIRDSYELLHKIFKEKGNYKQAYNYFGLFKSYSDSLFTLEKEKDLNRVKLTQQEDENKHLQQEKELQAEQIAIQSLKLRNRNLLAAAAILILALALIVILILIRNKKTKQRINRLLVSRNDEIIKQKNILEQQRFQLENQKEELTQLNDLKDKILSVISHDFKSPLNMIQSMLELVDNNALTTEEFLTYSPQLSQQVQKANIFLNDLLTWARNQFSGFRIDSKPVDISENCRTVVDLLQPFAAEKNIRIVNSATDQYHVYSEDEVFKLILRNILNNAIKFSPKNSRIVVGHRESDDYHWIDVADQGAGMSPEVIEDILNNRVMKNEGQSSGVGLFISKQFIEANGGKMTISSVLDEGTTFGFGLPKANIHSSPSAKTAVG